MWCLWRCSTSGIRLQRGVVALWWSACWWENWIESRKVVIIAGVNRDWDVGVVQCLWLRWCLTGWMKWLAWVEAVDVCQRWALVSRVSGVWPRQSLCGICVALRGQWVPLICCCRCGVLVMERGCSGFRQ